MAARKKQRIDSTSEQVRVMSKATCQIHPPSTVPLDDEDLPFFANVIEEFARSEWTAHQLELAALLARTVADLNREQLAMRQEGTVLTTDKGTPVVNPRKTVIQMHASTILSYRRSLGLNARAQGGEARDIAKRRTMAKQIEADNPLEDDLLARPQ
jgi:hypothetical protein